MRYGEEILFTMTGGRQMKKKILAAILTAAMTIVVPPAALTMETIPLQIPKHLQTN